eukprot:6334516-Alexandrium_andersonii.AAC.1
MLLRVGREPRAVHWVEGARRRSRGEAFLCVGARGLRDTKRANVVSFEGVSGFHLGEDWGGGTGAVACPVGRGRSRGRLGPDIVRPSVADDNVGFRAVTVHAESREEVVPDSVAASCCKKEMAVSHTHLRAHETSAHL